MRIKASLRERERESRRGKVVVRGVDLQAPGSNTG